MDFGVLASKFAQGTAFSAISAGNVAMLAIACVLIFLSARKSWQPAFLIPLGFGIVLANAPVVGGEAMLSAAFAAGKAGPSSAMDYLYLGLAKGYYPALMLLGLGALTDFGPMLANPRLMLVGLGAPVGVFAAMIIAQGAGLAPKIAGALAPVGGADLPSSLFLAAKLAPKALAPVAVGVVVALALYPILAAAIMRAMTGKDDRLIRMAPAKRAGQFELAAFPVAAFLVIALIAPAISLLAGFFFLGNLLRESGVTDRVSNTARSALIDTVTTLIGVAAGAAASAEAVFAPETAAALVFGVAGLAVAVAVGILFTRALNAASTDKVNPLVGGAAAASPEGPRVAQMLGAKEDPTNFLLAHASGVHASALIGTLVAAGILLSLFGL